jgi:hypothetical protein
MAIAKNSLFAELTAEESTQVNGGCVFISNDKLTPEQQAKLDATLGKVTAMTDNLKDKLPDFSSIKI